MATSYSPSVVTSGLEIVLDSANRLSYPGSGATWTDISGKGKNVTLVNSPSFDSANGGSIVFDGSDDYGSIAGGFYAITLGNGDLAWTTTAWVKSSTSADGLGQGSVISNSSGGPVYSMMGFNTGRIVYWSYYNGWYRNLGSTTINNNTWRMLTWVNYSNSTMQMFVDGVSDSSTFSSLSGNNNPLDIIGGSWAGRFAGSIAYLSINKGVALTNAQVLQNYQVLRTRFGV